MDLKRKTIRGLAWAGSSQVCKQAVWVVVTIVFVRILRPTDFGLLAIATVITEFLSRLMSMGMDKALIQKQDIRDTHYSSVFWFIFFIGICGAIASLLFAPWVAVFYGKPELRSILIVISLVNISAIILTTVQETLLTREMHFRKLAVMDAFSLVTSAVFGICFAVKGYGVWSPIFQLLTYKWINAGLLWIFSSWRPRLYFSISDVKEVFYFGANVAGANIITYLAGNIDKLMIARFLGVQALGYYSLSRQAMQFPLNNISWVVTGVMFPAFSKIKEDLGKVRFAYLKMIKAISLISFPAMCGLFVVAPELIRSVYGIQWKPAVILTRILCVAGMAQSVGACVGTIILSQGRSGLQFTMQACGVISVFFAILIGMRWGINGAAISYCLQSLIGAGFTLYIANRLVCLRQRDFYNQLWNSCSMSLVMITL